MEGLEQFRLFDSVGESYIHYRRSAEIRERFYVVSARVNRFFLQ